MSSFRYEPALQFEVNLSSHSVIVLDVPNSPFGSSDQAFFFMRDDIVYGYWNRCSHITVPLDFDDADFFDQEGNILCKVHGARYAADSGKVLQGPACYDLAKFECSYSHGKLTVYGWVK